jgi:hypothetical protein
MNPRALERSTRPPNLKDEKETPREVEKIATRLSNESVKQPSTA